MSSTNKNIAHDLKKNGVAYIQPGNLFYTDEDWQQINAIINHQDLPWEKILIGDADERNDLLVARFMTDIDIPRYVNTPLSTQLKGVVCNEAIWNFFSELLDGEDFYLRRMQVNKMREDSFIGRHLDIDSNPDYLYSVVLQLGQNFSGGEFTVYNSSGVVSDKIQPALGSVIISDCTFAHEVNTVLQGDRISLVFFVSKHADKNRRVRAKTAEHA
ncbi:2OG-Fe(II) oxygenase [Pseudomonas sp. 6D_7.1_Bac1]|uniref:2OG-Fe(II) oxygenase n=1 Tax=Pseudomonas sp. 6D_7.1_Bac1 TaxID=2971615 RepID=UPI0021C807C3|nr:2OG-Fe(II) oxygenase [Pseudomonas sp. 6D_7.1_Bac1]MCU1751842.1 2OG-Fe(II) oxygenase [Pseudomonas sp. 6D_7.1_Bac1]